MLPDQTQKFIDSLPKKVGDKVIFKGTKPFWYRDMIAEADAHLVVGGEYTLRSVSAASSWTAVTLEERHPSEIFNYSWFE